MCWLRTSLSCLRTFDPWSLGTIIARLAAHPWSCQRCRSSSSSPRWCSLDRRPTCSNATSCPPPRFVAGSTDPRHRGCREWLHAGLQRRPAFRSNCRTCQYRRFISRTIDQVTPNLHIFTIKHCIYRIKVSVKSKWKKLHWYYLPSTSSEQLLRDGSAVL